MALKRFLLGKRILLITAHPDDESFAAAGTLYENHLNGGANYLACATLGEKGKSHLEKVVSDTQLKKIRRRELRSACKILHVKKVFILGFPDGQVAKRMNSLTAKCVRLIRAVKPEIVMSFCRDGITGHLDHVAAGRAARKLAKAEGLAFLGFCFPPKLLSEAVKWITRNRRANTYRRRLVFSFPNVRVRIKPAIKRRALFCYGSQLDGGRIFSGYPKSAAKEMLSAEYFLYENSSPAQT